ncbi:MAG: hypothetical protein ACU837_09980 [Gammaproteobacteria bacterium]
MIETNTLSDTNSEQLIESHRRLGESVCARLQQEIDKLGFLPGDRPAPPCYADADFSVVIDPYSGKQDLTGHWFDSKRSKIGSIQFHAGGTFFAEYDVVKPHPRKPQWFVEAVCAWGRADNIKSEPKLLAALGS